MPGAEPAGTTPTPTGGGDTVIHLNGRRGSRTGNRNNGKGQPVDTRGPADTPEAILAQVVQGLYKERERTLNDHDTAEVFDIAIIAAKIIVRSAQADGTLSDGQHETLQRMLDTARRVPRIL